MISNVEPITGASAHTNCLTELLKSEPEPPTTRGKSGNYTPTGPAIKTVRRIFAEGNLVGETPGSAGAPEGALGQVSRPAARSGCPGQTRRTRTKRRLPT